MNKISQQIYLFYLVYIEKNEHGWQRACRHAKAQSKQDAKLPVNKSMQNLLALKKNCKGNNFRKEVRD